MLATHVETTVHGCRWFRVARVFPNINNAITIQVTTATGEYELTMFGLPRAITQDLMEKFSDADTVARDLPKETGGVAA